MNILAELRSRFAAALESFTDDPRPFAAMVKPAGDPRFGDFQANCAMPLANQLGIQPRQMAANIVSFLKIADICHEPEIAGPGFINLRLRDDWLEEQVNRLLRDERLGVARWPSPRTVVVDFSAPNIAKPMHVGHLRSTVIGDALRRILGFAGQKAIGDNHIGDWGTQFGMIIFGYKNFLDEASFAREPVAELARLYRLVNQLADYHEVIESLPKLYARQAEKQAELQAVEATAGANKKQAAEITKRLRQELAEVESAIADAKRKQSAVENDSTLKALAEAHPNIAAAREETARLHAGDEENLRLWQAFLPKCLEALEPMYRRLGVHFDLALGESYYQPMLADVVDRLHQQGLARESEGAICVFLESSEVPFIIRKQDGAFTYATTDLATIKYRAEELKADEVLYVVDARQSGHFRMLFETARRWGYNRTTYRHISFGTILGEDKRPFRTRAGDTIGLESLLDEAVARARQIVDANDDAKPDGPELDEATRTDVAEAVGIGGIKYADLRHNRDSDYVFSWEKMLAKTGDTATYIQYAYARISGIFRKGRVDREALRESGGRIIFTKPAERALAFQLGRFAEAVDETLLDYRPNILTAHLFETANRFATFYNECPVKDEEDEAVRTSRFLLCDLTARILSQGLALLGIRTCERM